MTNCIIASTSTLHQQNTLSYLLPTIEKEFNHSKEVLFIPYARPKGCSYDEYTSTIQKALDPIGKTIRGIHTYSDPIEAIKSAKNIYTGGGNTFLLVHTLYKNKLIPVLQQAILSGIPFLGTSAGCNICGLTMQTTNDMPIIQPQSYKTLSIVPFNINPHYIDPVQGNQHMGESRATRILEFHKFNTTPVVGLREGSWIHAIENKAILKGELTARIFIPNKAATEINPGSNINKIFYKY